MSSGKQFTIIDYYGEQTSASCGYCKMNKSSQSHGMWAHNMTVNDYQALIDRGWRRSGMYCYKADMKTTCCPLYTIKCDTIAFKPTKSQKKNIKRVNRFLTTGERPSPELCRAAAAAVSGSVDEIGADGQKQPDHIVAPTVVLDVNAVNMSLTQFYEESALTQPSSSTTTTTVSDATNDIQSIDVSINHQKMSAADPSKPMRKKAKLMRFERKLAKQALKGADGEAALEGSGLKGSVSAPPLKSADGEPANSAIKSQPKNIVKTLDELLNAVPASSVHKLKVKLVISTDYALNKSEVLSVYRKYQMTVHGDPAEKLSQKSFENFLVRSPLKVVLRPVGAVTAVALCTEEFDLYRRYQTEVHNDAPDNVDEFNEFLVTSPLQNTIVAGGPVMGFGSFHQQYYLDDRLIAVGVIDILPLCVSSVYFFYDPDYSFLSLGSYSSVREIHLAQQLNANTVALSNYYMGFYIHTCPKMRYKAKLRPSYLLCPEVYTWHLLDDSITNRLDAAKYQRMNNDAAATDVDGFKKSSDLQGMLLLINRKSIMTFNQCQRVTNMSATHMKLFVQYGQLVGKTLAHRMLYNV